MDRLGESSSINKFAGADNLEIIKVDWMAFEVVDGSRY